MAKRVRLKQEEDGQERQEKPQPDPDPPAGSKQPHPWQYSRGARPVPKTARQKPKEKPRPEVASKIAVDSVDSLMAQEVARNVLVGMRSGEVLIVSRTPANHWHFSLVPPVEQHRPLTKDEYNAIVLNPEYVQFQEMWHGMDLDQRKEYAEGLGIEWIDYGDDRTTDFRLSRQVYAKVGIKKYKPEYMNREVRRALRERGRKDE